MKILIQCMGLTIIKAASLRMNLILRNKSNKEIDDWFNSRNIFFILSMGRSGSLFLADLLNKSNTTTVRHEPNRIDFLANFNAFHKKRSTYYYVNRFRKQFIYFQGINKDIGHYGEVNSILRRHAHALKKHIPDVNLIHLVRDGRDVVRSLMPRRAFTFRDPVTKLIFPKKGEQYSQQWPKMSRFEKLCWYWMVENQSLMDEIESFVRFEDVLHDYDYFYDHVLDPLDLHVPQDVWQRKVNKPKNVTKQHIIPHWENWSKDKLDTFNNICGGLMKDFGYTDPK